jgi:glycosyltransferase involved in cell wall biosynthesis
MVIVDSDVQKKAAIGYGCNPKKILCFPWAVDLNRFSPGGAFPKQTREGRRTVLCARSHESVYGIEYLLEAIPIVVGKIPAARFVFVGSGSLTNKYREFVSKHGLDRNVEFLGAVSHEKMPEILASCDVYVTPSLSDGSSATLLEAMACAKPCIASDIPGNREWINSGVNGILVAPRDPRSLAEAVISLLKEPETAGRLGHQARVTVEQKADLEKNLGFFERRLVELVERRGSR